jgi:hypothetical protein
MKKDSTTAKSRHQRDVRPRAFEAQWKKTHRPAGGLFLGARFVYPVSIYYDSPQWKLVKGRFVRQSNTFTVWQFSIGLVFWTLTLYFRRVQFRTNIGASASDVGG